MKAILVTKYGPPDVLQLVEVEKPVPQASQVLVKVFTGAANPLDWHHMRGEPAVARLAEGLFKPRDRRLGADLAGVVETVGSAVTEFKPGDEVFGVCAGSFAEYALAGEAKLAIKPRNLTFEQAAAVPVVAFTALQGLRLSGAIQKGHKVLINGASGGVGTLAVQLARMYGAEVTGVCSARNLELVRSLGADHVIDYTAEDFTRTGQVYDLIYCAVGNRSVAAYKRALTPHGNCVIAGFTSVARLIEQSLRGSGSSKTDGQLVRLQGLAKTPKSDLLEIRDLLETEKIVPVIDRTYPLSQTADAIRYLETRRARGKVIVTIAHEDQNEPDQRG